MNHADLIVARIERARQERGISVALVPVRGCPVRGAFGIIATRKAAAAPSGMPPFRVAPRTRARLLPCLPPLRAPYAWIPL